MHECLTLKPMSKEFMPISQDKLIAGFLSKTDWNKLNNTQKNITLYGYHLIWGVSGKNICLNPETMPRTGRYFDKSLLAGKIVKYLTVKMF